ncbi:7136_t:CDS:2, partial [Acaulospora morrowiae]
MSHTSQTSQASQTSSQSFSPTALQDVISEESPPAYSPYPNSGERSMAFGPTRAFGDTPYQPLAQSTSPFPTYTVNSTIIGTGGMYVPPIMQSQVTAIHYPPGFFCTKCNNTGYESPGVVCQPCVSSYGIPSDRAYSGIEFMTINTINGGNVIYTRPGDPSIGGHLCTTCKGTGKEKFLFESILCTKCQ